MVELQASCHGSFKGAFTDEIDGRITIAAKQPLQIQPATPLIQPLPEFYNYNQNAGALTSQSWRRWCTYQSIDNEIEQHLCS
jgi:hypothetical protein